MAHSFLNYFLTYSWKFQLACILLLFSVGCTVSNTTVVQANITVPPPLTTTIQTTQVTSPAPRLLNNSSDLINGTQNSTDQQAPQPPQKPPPALGLQCNGTVECKANFSECKNHICSCQSGYIASKELLRCLPVVSKLEEECSEDDQCAAGLGQTVGPTTCLNFICSCAIGMSLIDGKCQGPTVLNANCSTDDDCSIKKSSCVENMCVCLTGFVPSSDNKECLPVNIQLQKLSGSGGSGVCTEDIQCQNGMGDMAVCMIGSSGGSCQCQPGTHLVKKVCIPYKDLGANCSFNEECISSDQSAEADISRICNQGLCKCDSSAGWIQAGNICTGGASYMSFSGVLLSLIITMWVVMRQ